MKLSQAIEILERWQKGGDITSFDDVNIAVNLGIEALKRHKAQECCQANVIVGPLPGETKE